MGRVGGVAAGDPAQVPFSLLRQRAEMECVDQWPLAIVPSNTHLGARNRAVRVKCMAGCKPSPWSAMCLCKLRPSQQCDGTDMSPARKRAPKDFRRGKWTGLLREHGVPCPPRRGYQSHKPEFRAWEQANSASVLLACMLKFPNRQCASGQSVPGRDGCSPQRGDACGSR